MLGLCKPLLCPLQTGRVSFVPNNNGAARTCKAYGQNQSMNGLFEYEQAAIKRHGLALLEASAEWGSFQLTEEKEDMGV